MSRGGPPFPSAAWERWARLGRPYVQLDPLLPSGPFGRIGVRVVRRVLSRNLGGAARFLDPGELRRLPDGTIIPVEIKSHAPPRGGPLASHRAQLLAYCLLVEELFGVPPPYGILCYGDGTEFRVTWDAAARAEVLAGLARLGSLYMGAADPAPAKCRACRFNAACSSAV